MNKQLKSSALLLLTAIIWGFAFVTQTIASKNDVGPFTFVSLRYGLGVLTLIPVVIIAERGEAFRAKYKHTVKSGIICGCVLFIASCLQQFGVKITESSGKSGFITGLYTVLVPIIGFIFLKKKTNVLTWIGAVTAAIGLYFLSIVPGERFGTGDLVLLIGAVFWALHILVVDRFAAEINPIGFSVMQFGTSAVLGLICTLIFESYEGVFAGTEVVVSLLYCGIMSTGVAFTFQTLGQKDADPTFAAIIMSTESVFSAVGGALILHERMSSRAIVGCALMFAGIVLSQIKPKNKEKNT